VCGVLLLPTNAEVFMLSSGGPSLARLLPIGLCHLLLLLLTPIIPSALLPLLLRPC
jgi:hypothetical protein